MILFQNTNFPTRDILLPHFGEVMISTQSLNQNLFDKNHKYTCRKAEQIDNQIFYFVENEQIDLSDNLLVKIIIKEVKY